MPTSAPGRFDLQSAADELGVHYQTAYRWVRSGRLPAVRVGGKYLVDQAAIDALAHERDTPDAPPAPSASRLERSADRLHRLLVDGDEPGARKLVRGLVDDGTPIVDLIQAVIVPPLVGIGSAWHDGDLSIWVEHRSSAIVERILGDIVPNPRGRRRGTAVVAAVSGDRHSLPTTMAAVALRADHWHVHHLGADIPVEEVARCCETYGADLAVVTVTNTAVRSDAMAGADEIRSSGTPVLIGGSGESLTELVEAARAAAAEGSEAGS